MYKLGDILIKILYNKEQWRKYERKEKRNHS